jgi:hypothetical protein
MSFELAQEVSTTFKGSSTNPRTNRLTNITDVEKKIEALTKLKSFLKRNDVDVRTAPKHF